jgi:hypothetical protein
VVDSKYRLTVEELQLFATQLETLPAKVEGREAVESLLQQVDKFQTEANKLLQVKLKVVFEVQNAPGFFLFYVKFHLSFFAIFFENIIDMKI